MILAFIQKTNLGFALSVSDFILFRYIRILTTSKDNLRVSLVLKSPINHFRVANHVSWRRHRLTSHVDAEMALDF